MATKFKNIALFGANGQLGQAILNSLIANKQQNFNIIASIAPGTTKPTNAEHSNVTVRSCDIFHKHALSDILRGADVVISALNGKALEAQGALQDVAADVGVKRFIPSEYGMHHIYRRPGDPKGYMHELWDLKERQNELAVRHPAIKEGKMSYTIIGCGDFYNQAREPIWCPWTQKDAPSYTIHTLGDPNAQADYTHISDFANFLTAAISEPAKSENANLNFVSDHISHAKIAELLREYSGKPVHFRHYDDETMHHIIQHPEAAPKDLSDKSMFPVDFWMLVKGTQGAGRFWRPPGQVHNHLFPEVEVTPFRKYFQMLFGEKK